MPTKTTLLALFTALAILPGKGAMVDFHFGSLTETGPAAIGNSGDHWNASDVTKGGPLPLQDVQGATTAISISWTSDNSWTTATKSIFSDSGSTSMDSATSWLMRSFACSYQYYTGVTNLGLDVTGLTPNQTYTLVLLGAGDQINEGTQFTVYGNGTFTGSTTGHSRRISAGPGNAYVSLSVVSSAQGTLKITTKENGYHYGVLNGFQLTDGAASTAPVTTTNPTISPASTASTGSAATGTTTRTINWGINGHPTWSDYAGWDSANSTTQMTYLNQLGCKYYRCAFDPGEYPSVLGFVVPEAKVAGVTVMPVLPLIITASATAQVNYNTDYQKAYTWATYAISKKYDLPYWELGNEIEGWGLVSTIYDGASPNDFPDEVPGGFVAIASGLKGAYQGIKDAYAAGRASGLTTITPQCLYGATFRHWGLLTKIQNYNGSLPCDIISWHWYGPCYGAFNLPIVDSNSASNGRTPAQCLNDFKSHTNPSQPMDIWITETNRSQKIAGGAVLNGSTESNTAPQAFQDWAAEAASIQSNVDSFKAVPTVKGIFVYELFDETKADSYSTSYLASEGYFGLVTGLNGVLKNAFYTYQTEIKQGP